MSKIAVVILNWNGKSYLEKFLPTLLKFNSKDAEIIIADNASTDDSIIFLKKNYPQLRIIQNKSNGGFSTGYNESLKQVESEYFILLNSDIEVSENWINPIIKLMDADKTIAACQPKILSYYEKNKFEYAGAAGGFIDKFGYPFCRGRIFNSLEEDLGQYNDTIEVFWATGACMFVRADLYNQFKGLDDDFFAHMEEIDFCWRMKNHGYKIMYCHESKVYHIGGGTLPKNNARKTFYNFRNNFALLYKNIPQKKIFSVYATRLFLAFIASLKFLAEGGFKNFVAVAKAHLSFYKMLKKLKTKRKKYVQKEVSLVYKKSIVWNYYMKRKRHFSDLKQKDFN